MAEESVAPRIETLVGSVSHEEWLRRQMRDMHDDKGHSEEKCIRCGWVMGHAPLNCNNDDTPHVFPSQLRDKLTLNQQIERVAKAFHETYEKLAPTLDYVARPESAVPWDEVPWVNRNLMIHVVMSLVVDGVVRLP